MTSEALDGCQDGLCTLREKLFVVLAFFSIVSVMLMAGLLRGCMAFRIANVKHDSRHTVSHSALRFTQQYVNLEVKPNFLDTW